MSDLAQIFLLALTSVFNPTLLAAVTVLLLLPSPKRLMLGYLLGAYTASISSGLVIVFALEGSGAVSTGENTVSPAQNIVFGALALLIAFVLATGRDRSMGERKVRRKSAKEGDSEAAQEEKESLTIRMLGRGDPRIAFVVGVLLSFPGASYLAGLGHMDSLEASTAATVLLVIGFCLVQLTLLELPLIGFALAPEWTKDAVARFRAWLARSGRHAGVIAAAVIGLLLIVRGVVELLT